MIENLNAVSGDDVIPQLIPFFGNDEIIDRYFAHLRDLAKRVEAALEGEGG